MKELKKQHLEMLQLLESIEVMLQNGNSIHPDSVIRGAIQTAIGMEVNVTNVNDKCDNKQTAVEWLFDNLNITGGSDDMKAFEQAKEMEKEQSLKMLPYDLDELAKEFAIQQLANPNEYEHSVYAATIKNTYMTGFQKALELLTFKSE